MLIIAKREFRSYFDSPIAYIVICLSFFALGLMFFFLNGGFWQLDRASVSRLFESAPMGLSFLVVPVVTMRLIAEERRSGTLGALGLVLVLVLSTLAYPIIMFKWPWNLGPLDMGPVASGYLGMVLFSCAAVAVGLLISALTESQAVAFFITFFVLGALWLFGDLASKAGGTLAILLNYVSFQSRLSNFWRGLIDSRDVIFFLSVTALSLMVAFRALERRKWA
jgi:ABC-2 type transport system permease protein